MIEMPGLKQRIENLRDVKGYFYKRDLTNALTELDKTIAEIEEMEGLLIDFDLISKADVLKALDSEAKGSSSGKSGTPEMLQTMAKKVKTSQELKGVCPPDSKEGKK